MGNKRKCSRRKQERSSTSSGSSTSSESSGTDGRSRNRRRHRHKRVSSRRLLSERKLQSATPPLENLPSTPSSVNAPPSDATTGTVSDILAEFRRITSNSLAVGGRGCDLPHFDPHTDDVNVWLHKISNLMSLHSWTDEYVCQLISSKLRGAASVWYKTLVVFPQSWDEWKNVLVTTFPPVRDLHSLMCKMLSIKPQINESLFDYAFRKLAAIRAMNLNLTGTDEVSLIIGDLGDDNLKFSIRAAGILNAEALAAHLKSLAVSYKKPSFNKNPISSSSSNFSSSMCFQCGQQGHLRRDCPSRVNKGVSRGGANTVVCFYCSKNGHTAANCLKRLKNKVKPNKENAAQSSTQQASSKPKFSVSYVASNSPNDKFFKICTINTNQVQVFIDFGSEISLITRELAQKLNLSIEKLCRPIIISVVGGNTIEIIEKTKSDISIDGITLNVEFLITTFCTEKCNVLLGQNFTESPLITYKRVGNVLSFSKYHHVCATFQNNMPVLAGELSESETVLLQNLINKFSGCFRDNDTELPMVPNVQFEIKLTAQTSISARPYRLSDTEKLS